MFGGIDLTFFTYKDDSWLDFQSLSLSTHLIITILLHKAIAKNSQKAHQMMTITGQFV